MISTGQEENTPFPNSLSFHKIIYYISKIQRVTVVLVLHFTFTLMITYITTSSPGNIRVAIRILH